MRKNKFILAALLSIYFGCANNKKTTEKKIEIGTFNSVPLLSAEKVVSEIFGPPQSSHKTEDDFVWIYTTDEGLQKAAFIFDKNKKILISKLKSNYDRK
jgi:hypothetical protein